MNICNRSSPTFGGIFDLAHKQERLDEIEELTSQPEFWNDTRKAAEVQKEKNSLKSVVDEINLLDEKLSEVEVTMELAAEGDAEELLCEAKSHLDKVEESLGELEFKRMLSGAQDKSSAILFINAGAGGTEACDWAEILLRMYQRWADIKGYKHEIVDFTPGDGAGFRSVTLTIEGEYSYGYLKAENGVHRLVRISPFDANKRRHTSFTSVFVLPEVEDDIEVEIRDEDLRVDTYRAGGAGGQHVNKTDSAVRLTHIPTKTVVACQNQRSQHQNKQVAMRLLRSKLYELEVEKKMAEQAEMTKDKKKIEWGSQIRSYVLQPYRMIKDHRTGLEIGNIDSVLDGNIDEFIKAFLLMND